MTSLTSNPSAVRFDDSNSKFNQAVSTSIKDFKEKKYEIMYVLNSDPSKELQEVNAVENTETSVTYKRADYYQAADDA